MLYLGLQTTTAVNAGLILGAQPALTVILAWMLIGDRLTPLQSFGVVVALAGVAKLSCAVTWHRWAASNS